MQVGIENEREFTVARRIIGNKVTDTHTHTHRGREERGAGVHG